MVFEIHPDGCLCSQWTGKPSEAVLTAFGAASLTFMMVMYALERRGRVYVLGFALGCGLSSAYGFLSGAWLFGVVEAVWAVVALRRFGLASAQRPK